ncbi:MAG TPA: hypothetical protein VGR59_13255 [Gemmatimonadaceae bacterium]|nr:hypothetical protein [Gemmatimonadaceae bacterium]
MTDATAVSPISAFLSQATKKQIRVGDCDAAMTAERSAESAMLATPSSVRQRLACVPDARHH